MHEPVVQFGIPVEVGFERLEQIGHGHVVLIVHMILQGSQTVRHRAKAHALDIGGVVPSPPIMIVTSCGNTIIHDHRHERRGHEPGEQSFNEIVALNLEIQKIAKLCFVGLHELIEVDHRLTPEISLESTPGHTPGHLSVRIDSSGERAIITGDMVHHPVQLAEPHWGSHPDSIPELAIQTRKDFVHRYGDQPVLVIGTHFSGPTAGFIRLEADSCRFVVEAGTAKS